MQYDKIVHFACHNNLLMPEKIHTEINLRLNDLVQSSVKHRYKRSGERNV